LYFLLLLLPSAFSTSLLQHLVIISEAAKTSDLWNLSSGLVTTMFTVFYFIFSILGLIIIATSKPSSEIDPQSHAVSSYDDPTTLTF